METHCRDGGATSHETPACARREFAAAMAAFEAPLKTVDSQEEYSNESQNVAEMTAAVYNAKKVIDGRNRLVDGKM